MLDHAKKIARYITRYFSTISLFCLFVSLPELTAAELYLEEFNTVAYRDAEATTVEWSTLAGELWMPYFEQSVGTPITMTTMYNCSAVLHPDSQRIYVFGASPSYNGVLHYNTVTQESVFLGNLFNVPVNNSNAVINPLTGDIYIFGGGTYSTGHNKIHRFNPLTHDVTELAAVLPLALYSMLAVYASEQGCIYIFGGESQSFQTNKILRFDLTSETLTELSTVLPMNMSRMGGALDEGDGKIYIFGGYSGGYIRKIHVFDPEGETINTLGVDLPYSMYNQKVIFDPTRGQFMLFKGYISGGSGVTIICFDPKSREFRCHVMTIAGGNDVMAVANQDRDRVFLLGSGQVVTILDLGYPDQAQAQSIKLNSCTIVSSLLLLADYQDGEERIVMCDSLRDGRRETPLPVWSKKSNLLFQVTANGGTTWEEVTPGIEHTFIQPGGDFRWRIVMTHPDNGIGTVVGSLAISYVTGPDTTSPHAPVVTDQGAFTASATQLQASWTPSETETCIINYEYSIGTTPGSPNVVDWTDVGLALSFTRQDLHLENCQTYYINVRATNQDNVVSSVGTSDGIKVIRTAPLFGGLTMLVPGAHCGTAELSWNAATPLPCAPAIPIRYNVYRSLNPASGFALFSRCETPVTGLTFTAADLQSNVNHYFLVRAEAEIDSLTGTGGCRGNEDGNAVVKTINLGQSIAFDGLQQAEVAQDNCGAVDLSWTPAVASCVGTTIHYNIYRSFDGVTGFNRITNCEKPLTDTFYRDTGVFTGKTYYYLVRAEDDTMYEGGPCGGFSEYNTSFKKVTIPHLSPTFDGLQNIVPLDSSALLTWNEATPACDGGIIRYNIFRTMNLVSAFQCITSCDNPIMGTTYTDMGLTNGETYYYMVRAEDNADLGGGDGLCNGNSDENFAILSVIPNGSTEMVPTLNTFIIGLLVVFISIMLYPGLRRSSRCRETLKSN